MTTDNHPKFEDDLPEDELTAEEMANFEQDLPPEEFESASDNNEASLAVLDNLRAENEDLKNRLLRALAETDNIRKRAEKERGDTAKFAVTGFAKQLITVADNLRRALESISEEDRADNEKLTSIFTGVEATERELLRAFDAAGITQIKTDGEIFNPNFHEVMFEADMPDKPAGTIIQVLEPGYMIHERLLRPARVGIAKGGPAVAKSKINEEI